MSDEPLPADAQVAMLFAKERLGDGIRYEIVVYRARRTVHVYCTESHGRRWYRKLVYTSDARFCLRSLQPSTASRDRPWAAWNRHEAGSPTGGATEDSDHNGIGVVITRPWSARDNLSLGVETYIPARLFHGLLPEALLSTHTFWQAEDDELRGYPINAQAGADLIIVNVSPSAHVALHGIAGSGMPPTADNAALTLPTRALVLRLKLERCKQRRDDVVKALEALEKFCAATPSLLTTPFASDFALHQAIVELLESGDMASFVDFAELINTVDVVPLLALTPKLRTSKILLPRIVEMATAAAQRDADLVSGMRNDGDVEMSEVPAPTKSVRPAFASASDVEASELVLLDLLHAPPDSHLYSLCTLIARVETLSHVLVWAKWDAAASVDLRQISALSADDAWLVALPRLNLTFEARRDAHGNVALFSIDHSDLRITNDRSGVPADLLEGMPHSLVCASSQDEYCVLLPSVPPVRPVIKSAPFSTDLVLKRDHADWNRSRELAYHLYPVHLSGMFLSPPTLTSALYLLLVRFQARAYASVVALIDTVATDGQLTEEQELILMTIGESTDTHPDAHACRLKLSCALLRARMMTARHRCYLRIRRWRLSKMRPLPRTLPRISSRSSPCTTRCKRRMRTPCSRRHASGMRSSTRRACTSKS